MLKRLKTLVVAMAATLSMTAAANAAPVIDFGTGSAGIGGNIVSAPGGHLIGTGIPIGAFTYAGTPVGMGGGPVFGNASGTTPGNYGSLDFNTSTGVITVTGCIPGAPLSIGTPACPSPQTLLTGNITSFQNLGVGIFITGGLATAPSVSAALGLPSGLPYDLFPSFSTTIGLTNLGNGSAAVSTDIRASAVPEPATMVLLGTGLVAAFRARRRKA